MPRHEFRFFIDDLRQILCVCSKYTFVSCYNFCDLSISDVVDDFAHKWRPYSRVIWRCILFIEILIEGEAPAIPDIKHPSSVVPSNPVRHCAGIRRRPGCARGCQRGGPICWGWAAISRWPDAPSRPRCPRHGNRDRFHWAGGERAREWHAARPAGHLDGGEGEGRTAKFDQRVVDLCRREGTACIFEIGWTRLYLLLRRRVGQRDAQPRGGGRTVAVSANHGLRRTTSRPRRPARTRSPAARPR
jgi:hypothetical protein